MRRPVQELRFYQSLWATEERRPGVPERPVEERFERVRAAGYHGMGIDLGALDLAAAKACVPLYARTGLGGLLTAFPKSIEDLRPALHLAKDIGAPVVFVIGQVMPLKLEEMVAAIRGWLAVAAEEGVPIEFETHRNCITNDLFSTLLMLEAVPEMRLSADLSHFVVDREMPQPVPSWLQAHIRTILERSDSLQGRVATRNQIQVPIAWPQHAEWLATFLDWWTEGMRLWRARAGDSDAMIFLNELGPANYAMTGPDGLEMSDRWQEALELRRLVTERWQALEATDRERRRVAIDALKAERAEQKPVAPDEILAWRHEGHRH
jgi:hypothetical protein